MHQPCRQTSGIKSYHAVGNSKLSRFPYSTKSFKLTLTFYYLNHTGRAKAPDFGRHFPLTVN